MLLTTIRNDQGTLCMLVSEIMGKEAFNARVFNIKPFFDSSGVEYLPTLSPVQVSYEGSKAYSCCGTMLNLIFSTVDRFVANGNNLDIDSTINTLTNTAKVDITETIERANTAIKQAIVAETPRNFSGPT